MRCGHGVGVATKGAYATVTTTADDIFEEMLPKVKATVEVLSKLNSALTHITYITINTTNLLKECVLEEALDPNNKMIEGLEQAEESLRGAADILRKKRALAESDNSLNGNYERKVISAFERAVVTVEGLHDAVVDFRWAILEHDAGLEQPTGNPVDSSEILKLAL